MPLQPPALTLGQAAPDAEPLIVLKRVLKALGPHFAATAHSLGLPGRSSLFGKERLRIGLSAKRPVLPRRLSGVVRAEAKRFVH